MSPGDTILLQGWLSLGIQAVLAIGTCSVAYLAIDGDRIRHFLSGPKLRLRLDSPEGELNSIQDGKKVRYYHFFLENLRPHAPAVGVKVMLLGVYRLRADGSFGRTEMKSTIPFTHQFYFNPGHDPRPTVCSSILVDLGFIPEGQPFSFSTYFRPNNFDFAVKKGEKVRVHARAEGDNAVSNSVFIETAWDGIWHEGTTEIQKHLVIRQIPSI